MIYESVARHVGLHQQSIVGSTQAVANPHKGDLDDLDDPEVQRNVLSEDRSNAQVENQDDAQVDVEVNTKADGKVDDAQPNTEVENSAQDNDQAGDTVTFTLK